MKIKTAIDDAVLGQAAWRAMASCQRRITRAPSSRANHAPRAPVRSTSAMVGTGSEDPPDGDEKVELERAERR